MTPFLDSLASRGVVFRQAATGGSWTQAAFPTVLTSTAASAYGGCTAKLSPRRPSPIQALADDGYVTAGFTGNPLVGRAFGYEKGFVHFEDIEPGRETEWGLQFAGVGQPLRAADPFLRGLKGGQFLLRRTSAHRLCRLLGVNFRPAVVYAPGGEVVERVATWLTGAREPFFVWVHLMDTHWPYHPPLEEGGCVEIAQEWRDLAVFHRAATGRGSIDTDRSKRLKRLYERAVARLDAHLADLVGLVTAKAERLGIVTIVISDHGEAFGEHGYWGHSEPNLYDEVLRVPLIVAPCRSRLRAVGGVPVSSLDVMPTILDLCDCTAPEGLEGESLLPLWTSTSGCLQRTATISEMWREKWHRVAVRTPEFKLIWDDRKPRQFELYDLKQDPLELVNSSLLFPEELDRLKSVLETHLSGTAATSATGTAEAPALHRSLSERLKALGYLDS